MSEQAVETPVEGAVEPQQETKAPWADYLEPLPDSVRPLVEPTFRKWEADTTRKFQEVHSQYEPFKPYQEILPEFGNPDNARAALEVMRVLNEDPEQLYNILVEQFGFGSDAGEQGSEDTETGETDETVDPRFKEVEETTNMLAELYLEQQRQAEEAAEDAKLDQLLTEAKNKYGDMWDEEWVLAHMEVGLSPDEAMQKYQDKFGKFIQPSPPAPVAPAILGGGGGLPASSIDPGSLSNKERRALVAQMLAQAAEGAQ